MEHALASEPKASPDDIAEFVDNPLWKALCSWLESGYRTVPRIEYSRCGMAPGWNVKYKKGGRALCTLYPAAGSFTCLVCIGQREAMAAEALLPLSLRCVRLYHTKPLSGSRWLMIPVTDEAVLTDVKADRHTGGGKAKRPRPCSLWPPGCFSGP